MCSKRWAKPVRPGRSSLEPTWYQTLTPTIGVRLAADALVVGAFQQTTNLEVGLKPSVFMLWLTGAASYSLNPTTNLELSYQLTYAGISWAELAPDFLKEVTEEPRDAAL